MFVDGSSIEKGCGVRMPLQASNGIHFEYALRFNFWASNNEAKYEAFIVGHSMARGLGVSYLSVFGDLQLIVNQIIEKYQTKDSKVDKYLSKLINLLA